MARRAEDEREIGGDGRGSHDAAVLGGLTLIRVTPHFAEGNLLDKLTVQVAPELAQELRGVPEEKLRTIFGGREVTRYMNTVALMVHQLMRHYTASVLGQIIPPNMGVTIILDRIRQAATGPLEEYRSYAADVTKRILEKMISGKDFEDEIRNLIALQKIIMLVLTEITNRLATLYAINLPLLLRPPLANVKIGVEAVRGGS